MKQRRPQADAVGDGTSRKIQKGGFPRPFVLVCTSERSPLYERSLVCLSVDCAGVEGEDIGFLMIFMDDGGTLAVYREEKISLKSLLVRLSDNFNSLLSLVIDGGLGEMISLSHGKYLLCV
jgi:hypothetical protein